MRALRMVCCLWLDDDDDDGVAQTVVMELVLSYE